MGKDSRDLPGQALLDAAWFDPIEVMVRARVRGFIENLVEAELDDALGRSRYQRRCRSLPMTCRAATKAAGKPKQPPRLHQLSAADLAVLASMQARVRAMQPLVDAMLGRHAGVRSSAFAILLR
jgi:hypothetical protein